jgi:hypothetical protein
MHFMHAVPSQGFDSDRKLAGYLDELGLPDGSVLIDSANGYGVIISSRRPRQFVINSDSDFMADVADPTDHVAFVAVGASDNFDIVAATYPHLFQTGEPFGALEREFVGGLRMGASSPTVWRLYRVRGSNVPQGRSSSDSPGTLESALSRPTVQAEDEQQVNAAPVPSVSEQHRVAPYVLLDQQFGAGDDARGWPVAPGVAWIDDSGYRLVAGPVNRFVSVGAPVAPPQDMLVQGWFHKTGGPPGGGYGLILEDQGPGPRDGTNQAGQYYVFEVGDLGEFGVWQRWDDHWVDLQPWTMSSSVHLDEATNHLEVEAKADDFTFRVNSVLIADLHVANRATGRVGVFLGGDLNQGLVTRFTVSTLD